MSRCLSAQSQSRFGEKRHSATKVSTTLPRDCVLHSLIPVLPCRFISIEYSVTPCHARVMTARTIFYLRSRITERYVQSSRRGSEHNRSEVRRRRNDGRVDIGDRGGCQLPTRNQVGLPVDSHVSCSTGGKPHAHFFLTRGFLKTTFSRGVRGTCSLSPTPGQADRLSVSSTASGRMRHMLFLLTSHNNDVLSPTAKAWACALLPL